MQDVIKEHFCKLLEMTIGIKGRTVDDVVKTLRLVFKYPEIIEGLDIPEQWRSFANLGQSQQNRLTLTKGLSSSRPNVLNSRVRRQIFCHVGGPKTGSSALQLFFAQNANLFESKGICYKHYPLTSHDYEFTSGNGVMLLDAFLQGRSDSEICQIIDQYFGEQGRALISCESFRLFDLTHWRRFSDICSLANIDPTFIMVIRDVLPFYSSWYHQSVKHGGETRSFDEFVREDPVYAMATDLQNLTAAFGLSKCRVLHYDSEREQLARQILNILGLDIDEFDQRHLTLTVNRGLTSAELDFMRWVNARFFDKVFVPSLAYALIYARPMAKRAHEFSSQWVALLQSRHQRDISWVNETYFGGKEVLKIWGFDSDCAEDVRSIRDDRDMISRLDKDAWRAALEWARGCLDRAAADAKTELMNYFNQHLPGAYVLRAEEVEKIPGDFNPIEYLVINRDVLDARVNAYRHYLDYGIAEGRAYRVTG